MPHLMASLFRTFKNRLAKQKPSAGLWATAVNHDCFPNVFATKRPPVCWALFMPWHVLGAIVM